MYLLFIYLFTYDLNQQYQCHLHHHICQVSRAYIHKYISLSCHFFHKVMKISDKMKAACCKEHFSAWFDVLPDISKYLSKHVFCIFSLCLSYRAFCVVLIAESTHVVSLLPRATDLQCRWHVPEQLWHRISVDNFAGIGNTAWNLFMFIFMPDSSSIFLLTENISKTPKSPISFNFEFSVKRMDGCRYPHQ